MSLGARAQDRQAIPVLPVLLQQLAAGLGGHAVQWVIIAGSVASERAARCAGCEHSGVHCFQVMKGHMGPEGAVAEIARQTAAADGGTIAALHGCGGTHAAQQQAPPVRHRNDRLHGELLNDRLLNDDRLSFAHLRTGHPQSEHRQ